MLAPLGAGTFPDKEYKQPSVPVRGWEEPRAQCRRSSKRAWTPKGMSHALAAGVSEEDGVPLGG